MELTGTHRTTRAASGSVSLYRYLEADTRLESFPRWRAAAWRAWNGGGSRRAGGYLGAEPVWGSLRLAPGFRLEADKADRLGGIAMLSLRWRAQGAGKGLGLDASGSIPCWPAADPGAARWRATVEYTGK
jgi:hypothetical protein